jgi:hypothetical protein
MNIEIYALCHQEAKIIPYFMRHYNQYGQVYLYEGHSTDESAELARSLGAIIVPLNTNNQVDDYIFTNIKSNCWKESKADWVIICDMDEFLYHPNFVEYLGTIKETIILPRTFEMIADLYPTTSGQIYDEVRFGFETTKKMFMFQPMELTDISYGIGCHTAQPEGNVIINKTSEIICMHMRHLSLEYIIQRNTYTYSRMSEINKKNGWGWHTNLPPSAVQDFFNSSRQNIIKVI